MSTQSSTTVSSTSSSVHLFPLRYQPRQLSNGERPTQLQRTGSDRGLDAAAFERFLYWLGPDPETAGRKYESIRGRLIMMFRARRCGFAEDLADATFERVVRKLTDLTAEFYGDPARYVYGVAKKIVLEYQREITVSHRRAESSLPTNTFDPDLESRLTKLDEALGMIPTSDRELILRYYSGSGTNKISRRRVLAEQFGLGPNALRLRVFRIRRELLNYLTRSQPDDYSKRF
jgi:DNA-directed RNA polymerase specialized sigma24 family protein